MADEPDLIEQYRRIHAAEVYGDTSVKNLRYIRPPIRLLGPGSVIDYGCGQSRLVERLGLPAGTLLVRYDPAIPEVAAKPDGTADLLINVDVLEHIPETQLDGIIAEMAGLGRDALIIVDTKKASKVLPSGENAHVTIRPADWWAERLRRHFPALYPIRVARRSRAAFRTWPIDGADRLRLLAFRALEEARFWPRRMLQGREAAHR